MGLSRIIVLLAMLAAVLPLSRTVWAAACITPTTAGAPVPYKSPPRAGVFTYRITHNPHSKTPDITHHRYRVKSIMGDKVRWFREPVQGKGPIQDVTLYRAFARTAAGGGWLFNFDVGAFDKLWPLQQGNEVSYQASATKEGKLQFNLTASFCVRGTKTLKLLAGEFEGHLIDITIKVEDPPADLGWDLAEINAWYVTEFGTALLMEDRITRQGKLILMRRREAMEVPDVAQNAGKSNEGLAAEPSPPNFQFPGLNSQK